MTEHRLLSMSSVSALAVYVLQYGRWSSDCSRPFALLPCDERVITE